MFDLTFLNGLFLAGAAAGIVPILIHLLNRRRLQRVEFSDLRFLAPLSQQRMRSLNLRRLLLLVLRVAIVVFTAVAMARPSVRGAFSRLLPARARSSVLLLVDTSYSMRTESEGGTALDAAKATALHLLDSLDRGDEVNLMTFDDAPRLVFQTPVHDLALVRERIAGLQPSHGRTAWVPAMQAALAALADAGEPNRELYVLSDFAGASHLDSLRADLAAEQKDVRVSFVPVDVEPFPNVSVDDVRVPPGAVLLDEPSRVAVDVHNHAADVPAEASMQVELGGDPKGEASLRLAPGARATHEFTLVATRAEAAAGLVRKRIDRLPEDDMRWFVLPVLGQLRVLLVRGAGDAGGSFYVARALAPARAGRTPLALAEVNAVRFSSVDLGGVQVVVLASDARLGDSQAQVLADFVREGGGVMVLTGRRDTAEPVNRMLLERLGSARVRGVVERSQGYLNLEDMRPAGLLAGFDAPELQALGAVKFTRYAELVAGSEGRVVLRFTGGAPALVEGTQGNGRYLVFAFDAGMDGSDLAVSPMFLPLVHRAVVSLAGETGRQKLHGTVGERIEVQVPLAPPDQQASGAASAPAAARAAGDDAARNFTVTTPSGRTEALVPRYVGRLAILSCEDTREPGHYVFEGAGRRLVRAVNVDPGESDLRRLDTQQLAKHLGVEVADTIDDPTDIARSVREARHGKEIYKLVVVLVLALMTVELLLGRAARESEPA